MCTIEIIIVMRAVISARDVLVYSKHVTRLNLVKYGWEQGMQATIVAHNTSKQEDAIRMNQLNSM